MNSHQIPSPHCRQILLLVVCIGLWGCQAPLNLHKQSKSNHHMGMAKKYLDRSLTDAALAAFGLALEENPRVTDAHMGMGDIYRLYGNYELASRAYERATYIDPNHFSAHYYLALMRQMLGRLDEAIATYLKALAINPRSFEANRDITAAYLQLGQMSLAVRYAERATELAPDSQESWTNLAAAYSLQGRYNESVNAYRQAAEQGSLNNRVLLGLANAHIRLGNYPRAINVLNSLIHREPSSTAYERLGYANFKQREFRQALKNFQISLSLVENDTAALNGVGVCLMTLYIQGGRENLIQRDQAVGAWRKSVQLRPDQPRIVDLISRYERM